MSAIFWLNSVVTFSVFLLTTMNLQWCWAENRRNNIYVCILDTIKNYCKIFVSRFCVKFHSIVTSFLLAHTFLHLHVPALRLEFRHILTACRIDCPVIIRLSSHFVPKRRLFFRHLLASITITFEIRKLYYSLKSMRNRFAHIFPRYWHAFCFIYYTCGPKPALG